MTPLALSFNQILPRTSLCCSPILSPIQSIGRLSTLWPRILWLSLLITNTTPVLDLNVLPSPAQQIGNIVAHKVASSAAPVNATKREAFMGNGAVDWLYLNTTNATQGNVRAIYRANTAGSNPPKTCESSDAAFNVQYAAENWFYSIP